jgi:predicted DNA-binding transcriptional regulator YafY
MIPTRGDREGSVAKRTQVGRRPSVQITLGRASRLYRLVKTLAEGPRTRDDLLRSIGVGLRTFYRELELLKRCGIKVRLVKKDYVLRSTAAEAEGRLPFPDPQLSFAEMAELARGDGAAARRLAELLASVVADPDPAMTRPKSRRSRAKPKLPS